MQPEVIELNRRYAQRAFTAQRVIKTIHDVQKAVGDVESARNGDYFMTEFASRPTFLFTDHLLKLGLDMVSNRTQLLYTAQVMREIEKGCDIGERGRTTILLPDDYTARFGLVLPGTNTIHEVSDELTALYASKGKLQELEDARANGVHEALNTILGKLLDDNNVNIYPTSQELQQEKGITWTSAIDRRVRQVVPVALRDTQIPGLSIQYIFTNPDRPRLALIVFPI